eukprot:1520161-Rhodomonas_salina.1
MSADSYLQAPGRMQIRPFFDNGARRGFLGTAQSNVKPLPRGTNSNFRYGECDFPVRAYLIPQPGGIRGRPPPYQLSSYKSAVASLCSGTTLLRGLWYCEMIRRYKPAVAITILQFIIRDAAKTA